MSAPFGMYGGYKPESTESRALGSITSDSYDYRDQAKFLTKMAGDVGYMAAYMRKMQRGIDAANENFVQQIQSLINDFMVLFAGSGDTGFDFGDVKYLFQAIGALFGFDAQTGIFPINLVQAAWHFFSTYILPGGNFKEAIEMIVDGIIASVLDIFGEVPILGQALQQLAVIISEIRDALLPIFEALEALLGAFDFNIGDLEDILDFFGPLKPIFNAFKEALDGINLPNFIPVFNLIAQWTQPGVNLIVAAIQTIAVFIRLLTGNATTADLNNAFKTISQIANPDGPAGGLGIIEIGVGIIENILDPTGLLATISSIASAIGLDFSGPINFLTSLAEGFSSFLSLDFFNLLDFNSPVNVLNLFGLIPSRLFGPISFHNITGQKQNLLTAPEFDDAENIKGSLVWTYDPDVGKTSPGSAKIIGNGTLHRLVSNKIPVETGDPLDFEVWVRWVGAVFSGVPIRLQVVRFLEGIVQGADDIAVPASPGSNQTTWIKLSNSYTTPAGCDEIALQFLVPETTTAGTFNWDDAFACYKRVFKFDWIPGLPVLNTMVNQILEIISGMIPTPINESIQNFQDWVNGLFSRFESNESDFDDMIDGLWGGFRQLIGIGKSAADVANAASDTAGQADTAVQIGEWNNAVLGLRNNKSLMEGVDETEEANFMVDRVWAGSGSEPAATIGATSTFQPTGFWRAGEVAKKGFISWFGKGFTGITSLKLRVYQANYTLSRWEPAHTSPNLISMIDNTWRYHVYNIADEPYRINVVSGDVLAVRWMVEGTGTHQIAGESINGMPEHPTIHPKLPAGNMGHDGGAGARGFDTMVYINQIPWFGIGIITGDLPPPYYAPRTFTYTNPGSGTFTIPPEFRVMGNIIDRVAVGGGRGGGGALGAIPGTGGRGGNWNGDSIVYGVDVPLGTTTLDFYVGKGGDGGLGTVGAIGLPGEDSTISGGSSPLVAGGGHLRNTDANTRGLGTIPTNFTYPAAGLPGSKFYQGGGEVSANNVGKSPGGGGAGGVSWTSGKNAASGGVYITVRQP